MPIELTETKACGIRSHAFSSSIIGFQYCIPIVAKIQTRYSGSSLTQSHFVSGSSRPRLPLWRFRISRSLTCASIYLCFINPLGPPVLGERRRTGDTPVPLAGRILHLSRIGRYGGSLCGTPHWNCVRGNGAGALPKGNWRCSRVGSLPTIKWIRWAEPILQLNEHKVEYIIVGAYALHIE